MFYLRIFRQTACTCSVAGCQRPSTLRYPESTNSWSRHSSVPRQSTPYVARMCHKQTTGCLVFALLILIHPPAIMAGAGAVRIWESSILSIESGTHKPVSLEANFAFSAGRNVSFIHFLYPTLSMNNFLVALGVLACVFIFIALNTRELSDVQRLPGPSAKISSWIWGHELLIFQHAATQMYSIWARSFGGLFKIKAALFHSDIAIATDHAAVHYILANSDLYVKSPAFRPPIKNLLGKGVLWAEGDDWHRQRKILGPAFSTESVKEMTSAIHECAERLETRLTNLILFDCAPAKDGTRLNVVPFISACTLDIIGAVALSHSFSAQSAPRNDIHSDAAQIRASWTNHVNIGLRPLAFLAPIIVRAIPAVTRAPLPLIQSQGVVKTIVRQIGYKIVEREQSAFDKNNSTAPEDCTSQAKDIISILLRGRRLGTTVVERLSDEQILDNGMLASTDIHFHYGGPRDDCWMSRLHTMGAGTPTGDSSSYKILSRLWFKSNDMFRTGYEPKSFCTDAIYLMTIFKSSNFWTRWLKKGEFYVFHPPSPQTERVVLQDDSIPLSNSVPGIGTTLRVKKGQVIHIPFTPMHTNPRNCTILLLCHMVGADFYRSATGRGIVLVGAILELKIMLATLIRSIMFAETGVHVEEKISPTLQPVVGGRGGNLPLRLKLV
ncbi:hypothetical protein MVEN_00746000 [Mycena venus]|uniref:Cytochrome P450 n=1 Tax=Mycena venus TaxID=2733690 RepID=A0A8H7D2Y6_9AGAR|nr:hypothetical protein MVEN_00746000 [Mycena venus]